MTNKYPILNKNYHIHYFGNISFIDDIRNTQGDYFYISLDEVGTDIIKLCDGLTNIEELHRKIAIEYNLDIDDKEPKDLLLEFINNFISKGILDINDTPSNYEVSQSGEIGKLYPFHVAIELTNTCNLRCKHCYKEATLGQGSFLDYKKIESILKFLKGKTPVINLVGGEPTLHPCIDEILSISTVGFSTTLISNGTNINSISDENIKKLRSSQVSMYGYDANSYKETTGNDTAFLKFCEGIKKLKKNKIHTSVVVIINKDNIDDLEKFIKVLIDLKADEIKFGLASLHGRAIYDRERWIFNQKELRQIQSTINMYHDKYIDFIKINTWDDDDFIYDDFKNSYCKKSNRDKYNLNCLGGKTTVTISEKGIVRPCSYLPNEIFNMGDYKDYFKKILAREEYSFNSQMQKYEKHLNSQGIELGDIRCKGFS